MHGAIREYKVQAGTAEKIVAAIDAEFLPLIASVPGFAAYTAVLAGEDHLATLSVFENEAGAADSVKLAAGWVKTSFAALVTGPPRITIGEITVRHAVRGPDAAYVVFRRFASTSEDALEITKRVRAGLIPILNAAPGFSSFELLVDGGRDRGGVSLSAFTDRAGAEKANEDSLAWVKENVGALLSKPPHVVVGEIKLRRARAAVSAI